MPANIKGLKQGIRSDRYPNTFFFKADRNTSAGPLPEFVMKERPAVYDEHMA